MKKFAFLFTLLSCIQSFGQPISTLPNGSKLIVEHIRPVMPVSQETDLISACSGGSSSEIFLLGESLTQASIVALEIEKGERKLLGQFKPNGYRGIHRINDDFVVLSKSNGARVSFELINMTQKTLVPISTRYNEVLLCSQSENVSGLYFVNKDDGTDVLYHFPIDGKSPQLISKMNGIVQSAYIDKNGNLLGYLSIHKNELCLYTSNSNKPAAKVKSWPAGVYMKILGFNESTKSFLIQSNVWQTRMQFGFVSIENGNTTLYKSNPPNSLAITNVIATKENVDVLGFTTTTLEHRNISFTENGKKLLSLAEKSIGTPQFSVICIDRSSTLEIFKITSPETKSKFIVSYKSKFIDVSKGSNSNSGVYRGATVTFNDPNDNKSNALFFKGNSSQASTPPLVIMYSSLQSPNLDIQYSSFIQNLCSNGYDVMLLANPTISSNTKFDVNEMISEQTEMLNSVCKNLYNEKRNNCQNICFILPEEFSVLTPVCSAISNGKNTLICTENFDNQFNLTTNIAALTKSDESISLLDVVPFSDENAIIYTFGNSANVKTKNQLNKNFNFTFSKNNVPSKEFLDAINAHFRIEMKLKPAGN